MGILVTLKDFGQGAYRFQFNSMNEVYYTEFIENSEKLWIKTIMGEKLGDEFINDPNEPRWDKIKEPFIIHDRHCYGIKACLVAFIYSDLIKSDGTYSAQSVTKVKSEVTKSVDIQGNYSRAYNNGVTQAKMIRRKLHIHAHDHFTSFQNCHIRPLILSLPI